ncbi:MAG: hypothetical protein J5J06_10205 [Phycisphaerae bacterium]|nr:hypothetical protein [Phycisphaerae bacterium]
MSTIVAIQRDGQFLLAADTLVTTGPSYSARQRPQSKIMRFADSLIGVSGLSVYVNILNHWLDERKRTSALDSESEILAFMLEFWRDLRQNYHYVQETPDGDDPSPFADLQAQFLIVNRTGIFDVREILSISRHEGFCAIGSGAPHANGALEALWDAEQDPERLARRAIQIAATFDRATGDEVVVLRGS